jgi:hypothetical protein
MRLIEKNISFKRRSNNMGNAISKYIQTLELEGQVNFGFFELAAYGKQGLQGIHLLCPTKSELDDAVDVALRDNFEFIYIYI